MRKKVLTDGQQSDIRVPFFPFEIRRPKNHNNFCGAVVTIPTIKLDISSSLLQSAIICLSVFYVDCMYLQKSAYLFMISCLVTTLQAQQHYVSAVRNIIIGINV